VKITELNYVISKKFKKLISNKYKAKVDFCIPRMREKKEEKAKEKAKWSFPISLFKNYKMETEVICG
jgi:hypothetical protein